MATETATETGKSEEIELELPVFYITRESQQNRASTGRKHSYAGVRNLSDLDKIQEEDIIGPKGTIRGMKNRVRAGIANFENTAALYKKSQEEGKIIVYMTSFRGVRSTFEECKYVLSVLHNLRVAVEERDIYKHKFFYNELESRMGRGVRMVAVPQVFINGQHIGGAQTLEQLNESGELRLLLANFPRLETAKNCRGCAGYEFIPCRKCGGSKNSVANNFTVEFKALKCTHCNENGLEPCHMCTDVDTPEETDKNEKSE